MSRFDADKHEHFTQALSTFFDEDNKINYMCMYQVPIYRLKAEGSANKTNVLDIHRTMLMVNNKIDCRFIELEKQNSKISYFFFLHKP